MRTLRRVMTLVALCIVAALGASAAHAGGPLMIYDPATGTPYTWPGANASVYTDLGTLGPLTNAQANAMFQASVQQWSTVSTSSFHGAIAGDFAALGLPDIDSSNLPLVLGTWNGGGVHVIYDADGSIISSIFGSPYGVLGVTIPEFVSENSPDILEVTMILNGFALPTDADGVPPDQAAAMYGGVTTHEFGHAIGLGHSQTNGQIVLFYEPWTGPAGCGTPYTDFPANDDIETMYPFTNLYATGIPESTIDIVDDRSAVSDLYPASGWPGGYPAIAGTIAFPRKANTPQTSPLLGSNVIARNVDNPFRDAISAISGDHTQGLAGADGSYALHGLTAGASYVVYVDGILYGAFATLPPTVLPGPEEYWNGSRESGNGETDDRCTWTTLSPTAGAPALADVVFNKVKVAPEFSPIDLPNSTITELSGDGRKAVGLWDGGVFRWTPSGIEDLPGADFRSPQAGISHDGRTITASALDANGLRIPAIYRDGQGWSTFGAGPNSSECDSDLASGWGVSNDRTVVGLDWRGCTDVSAFRWNEATGFQDLGYLGTELGGSRANRISADASTIVGWDQASTGFWRGAVWRQNQETIFTQPPVLCCDFDPTFCEVSEVGTATAVNPDGSVIVGEYYANPEVFTDPDTGEEFHYCSNTSWKWTPDDGVQQLGDFLPDYTPLAEDVSDDGRIIVGVANPFDFFLPRRAVIWTAATGFLDFQEFLQSQGTYANDWSLAVAGTISGDGRTVGGFGFSTFGGQGFIVEMPKAIVCHASPNKPSIKRTMDVSWPDGVADHLAHGDTIGLCGNGQ